MSEKVSAKILKLLQAVTALRPKRVIEHILKHGHVTTEELKTLYGYNHPPRAARDVRELGIPLETFRVDDSTGRKIAAYRFGDLSQNLVTGRTGRVNFPKKFKLTLIEQRGKRCTLCAYEFHNADLQIDHCVPYEVGGQAEGELNPDDYMLVCRTCNRGKSWSCEHCENWTNTKDAEVCKSCFWGNPISYQHIALRQIRRLNLVWSEGETGEYDELANRAAESSTGMPDFVKQILRKHLTE